MKNFLFLFIIVLMVPLRLNSEIVYMKDGQILKGSIIREDRSTLIVKTRFQTRKIYRDHVKRILYGDREMESINILLKSGEILKGYLVDQDAKQVIFREKKDATWNEVKSETVIHDGGTGAVSSTLLSNGYFLISYRDYDDTYKGKYVILDTDSWKIAKTESIFHDAQTLYISPMAMSDGNILFAYGDQDDSVYGKYVVIDKALSHIKVSSDAIINGITLTSRDSYWLNNLVSVNNSKLTLKWCDICSNNSSTSNQTAEAVHTNGELVVQNCRFYGNDGGIFAGSGKVRIIDSQFYNNGKGYALHMDGPAVSYGDVLINHADFFNNYGGIRLENNNGANEIIKNSVFHMNRNGGITADSRVTLNNSVFTDTYTGMAPGTDVVDSDPLYLNEGTPDFGYIDLFIQTVLLGYPADSPAKGLGDDLRNAGAYDSGYAGE